MDEKNSTLESRSENGELKAGTPRPPLGFDAFLLEYPFNLDLGRLSPADLDRRARLFVEWQPRKFERL